MTINYSIKHDGRGEYPTELIENLNQLREIDDVEKFLHPSKDDMYSLVELPHIAEAYAKIRNAIDKKERIGVLFDCDLDGVSAGAEMVRGLHDHGVDDVVSFINDGKSHGVQMNADYWEEMLQLDVLIIVDSLNGSINAYKALAENGVTVIVFDHHKVNPEIPYDKYVTLVTSQTTYPNKSLCGSGVVWKFLAYMDMVEDTDYAMKYCDLCACGLVGDMMSMREPENRYLVWLGLQNLQNLALKKIVGSYPFTAKAIAFSVAPLINAAMRINANQDAMRAFLTDDNKTVLKHLRVLKNCRKTQNEEVDRLLPEVLKACDEQINNRVMVVFIDTPYGITGLLGNKLLEKYQRPLMVLRTNPIDGEYKGSMRAIGVDDFAKIINDTHLGIAEGHELAAGMRVKVDDLEDLINTLEVQLPEITSITTDADIQLDIEDLSLYLVDTIKQYDIISGTEFPSIKFYVEVDSDYEIGTMSDGKHLVIHVGDNVDIIKWNSPYNIEAFEDASVYGNKLCVVGTLDESSFGKKKIQVIADSIEIVQ